VAWRISRLIELIFYRKGIDRVYGPIERVHGVPAHRSTDHIKSQSLILWSVAQIECAETVSLDQISSVDLKMDGWDLGPSEPIRTI
jgi:hypothetical protein